MLNISEQAVDNAKILTSVGPAALTFVGVGLQDWVYITSAIVAVMVMVEKLPMVYRRIKEFFKWIAE